MRRYVVGISGASGVILAVTLVTELAKLGHHVDVIISPSAKKTLYYELDTKSFLATITIFGTILLTNIVLTIIYVLLSVN